MATQVARTSVNMASTYFCRIIPDSKVHEDNMGPMVAPWTLLSGILLSRLNGLNPCDSLDIHVWYDVFAIPHAITGRPV